MFNIIICEDDLLQLKALEAKIKQLKFNEECFVHSFTNITDMLHFCKKTTGNFIFMIDIVLGNQIDGIEVAKYLNQSFPKAIIIFISAYLEKITDVYETEHCYFIYKPEIDMRLEPAIKKAVSLLNDMHKTITVKVGNTSQIIHIDDIYVIERIKRYSLIKCKDEVIRTTMDFSELFPSLNHHFHQCHRSYIINFDKVKSYNRTDFTLINNDLVPISRSYAKIIHERFLEHLTKEI